MKPLPLLRALFPWSLLAASLLLTLAPWRLLKHLGWAGVALAGLLLAGWLVRLAWRRLLWRVGRRLAFSYLLLGALPLGLFALARVFISLAAMDIGTAFGTLGARREMLVGFLAEPALLLVLFSAS
ncbi:MAG TPA: hypothetical protein PKZ08_16055, partial [Vicinamibacterales bacterium]|nr:hypothetical protein [Vicinamibacterales bacterium]